MTELVRLTRICMYCGRVFHPPVLTRNVCPDCENKLPGQPTGIASIRNWSLTGQSV